MINTRKFTALLAITFACGMTVHALAQDSGAAQQAPPAQAAPPAPNAPPPPPPGPRHGMPSVNMRVRHLTKKLGLNADQQNQIRGILQDQQGQIGQVMQDSSLAPRQRHQQMKSIREDTQGKIRAQLNDNQKQRYDQLLQQQKEKAQARRQGAGT